MPGFRAVINLLLSQSTVLLIACIHTPGVHGAQPTAGYCWGENAFGGDCKNINFQGVDQVESIAFGYVALSTANGTGQCWGYNECGHINFNGVDQLFHSAGAFLALSTANGTGQCWGSVAGDDCSSIDFKGVDRVFPTTGAFLALSTARGMGQCWGVPAQGGNCSHVDFKEVDKVFSTQRAFLALNSHRGIGQCWGESGYGGNCSHVNFEHVDQVVSAQWAFLALRTSMGTGECWGAAGFGGDCSHIDFEGVDQVFNSPSAFLALSTSRGTGQCWGDREIGGDCSAVDFEGVSQVYHSESAFLALSTSKGLGQCWGHPVNGGDCSHIDFTGVDRVFATGSAFLALDTQTGTGQCWGNAISGGECSTIDFRGIDKVFASPRTFVALNTAGGTGQCWGEKMFGANCQHVNFRGVDQVLFTSSAILALNTGLACGAGKFRGFGQPSCSTCPPGFAPSIDGRSCDQCADGQYAAPGDSTCATCPGGMVPSADGGNCTTCDAGHFKPWDQAICSACPRNTQPNIIQTMCIPCHDRLVSLPGEMCHACPRTQVMLWGECRWWLTPSLAVLSIVILVCSGFMGKAMQRQWRTRQLSKSLSIDHLEDLEMGGDNIHSAVEKVIEIWKIASTKKLEKVTALALEQVAGSITRCRNVHDWRNLHAIACAVSEAGWEEATECAENALKSLREWSESLGVSLRYVLKDFPECIASKMSEEEWRTHDGSAFTLDGLALKCRWSKQDPSVEWNASFATPAPQNPTFSQMAPVVAFGKRAIGYAHACPRDGMDNSSVVDALHREGNSGDANYFLSWAWCFDLCTVTSSLNCWVNDQKSANPSFDVAHVYIWWCFFVNNQFRMLTTDASQKPQDLARIFGGKLRDVGKMLIMMGSVEGSKYMQRTWCIFECFVATSKDIPCTILLPELTDSNYFQVARVDDLLDAFAVDAASSTATSPDDEHAIKQLILQEHGSYQAVNHAVQLALTQHMVRTRFWMRRKSQALLEKTGAQDVP